jgi:uncharacterized repeat protein (TIGR03803 family)
LTRRFVKGMISVFDKPTEVLVMKPNGWIMGCVVLLLVVATAIAASAQTFTRLTSFYGSNGADPYFMSLTQGADGQLYGTTRAGGDYGSGEVFKITPQGAISVLYSFCSQTNCVDGSFPYSGLVQGTDGNFYGTAIDGGQYGRGEVFKISHKGSLSVLYSFCSKGDPCTDGSQPAAGLIRASDGNFYGTTTGLGGGSGTVFKITPGGSLTTLHSFDGDDGSFPYSGLVQAADGRFYGTTSKGGANNSGTIFKITAEGVLTTLYSFCTEANCTDGDLPYSTLTQASDGNFYGTTEYGGTGPCTAAGIVVGCGTIFEVNSGGTLATSYRFCSETNCTDGSLPYAGLVQATDGNFYGTTSSGGTNDHGTVFELTAGGVLATLHSFDYSDGADPLGGLVQATSGTFYGTTFEGGAHKDGAHNYGTIFSLSVGLGAFVKTLPAAARVGAEVGILGNKLTGATSVTFNGVPADFTVRAASLIITHVPAGATTGVVNVALPTGTLSSNVPFYVLP